MRGRLSGKRAVRALLAAIVCAARSSIASLFAEASNVRRPGVHLPFRESVSGPGTYEQISPPHRHRSSVRLLRLRAIEAPHDLRRHDEHEAAGLDGCLEGRQMAGVF